MSADELEREPEPMTEQQVAHRKETATEMLAAWKAEKPLSVARSDVRSVAISRYEDELSYIASIERLRSDNAEMRAVLTELLRLYDWRFELANEEGSRAERCVTGTVEWADDIRRMDKLLNQYGREKKAAWQRLREVLAK